ncbi:hypothetical protein ACSU6B_05680 [Neobacillus sp. C211]|uniref:hypothetical protein n=1 Tax=unclassified Neobacillus TaxID=2675272 RepID=UPI00397D3D4E
MVGLGADTTRKVIKGRIVFVRFITLAISSREEEDPKNTKKPYNINCMANNIM